MKQISVKIHGQNLSLPIGTTVEDVLLMADIEGSCNDPVYEDNPFVGALVNHELHSCSRSLVADCTVEPVRLFGDMGKRIYRHSLCYLLCAAVSMLYPQRRLVIGHSLGDGYYFSFDD
jgi:uridine kinase